MSDRPEWFTSLWDIRPTAWRVTDPDRWIQEVEETYQDLDILHEARRARDWMEDNASRAPKRRLKTFFNGWLSRARQYARSAAGVPTNSEGDQWGEAAKRSRA